MDNTKRSIMQNDQLDLINARLLRKGEQVDYSRVEGASLKIMSKLQSPEGKRLFLRLFGTVQLQINLIGGVARAVLDVQVIDPLVDSIKVRIDNLHKALNMAIDGAEILFKQHGIVNIASYDTPPLEVEVPILSAQARRYYEAIVKFDQLMPLLQTLQIHEVVTDADANDSRARLKGDFRAIAGVSRRMADRLRTRLFQEAKEGDTSNAKGGSVAPVSAVQGGFNASKATAFGVGTKAKVSQVKSMNAEVANAKTSVNRNANTNEDPIPRLSANARKRRNRRIKREAEAAARATAAMSPVRLDALEPNLSAASMAGRDVASLGNSPEAIGSDLSTRSEAISSVSMAGQLDASVEKQPIDDHEIISMNGNTEGLYEPAASDAPNPTIVSIDQIDIHNPGAPTPALAVVTSKGGRRKERNASQAVHTVVEQPIREVKGVDASDSGDTSMESISSEDAARPSVAATPDI